MSASGAAAPQTQGELQSGMCVPRAWDRIERATGHGKQPRQGKYLLRGPESQCSPKRLRGIHVSQDVMMIESKTWQDWLSGTGGESKPHWFESVLLGR